MDAPELEVVHEEWPPTPEFRRDWERLHRIAPGANVFTTLEWMGRGWTCFAPERDTIRPVRYVNAAGETVAVSLHKETASRRFWGHVRAWRTLDYNSQRIVPALAKDFPHLVAAALALYRDVASRIDVFEFFKLDPLDGDLRLLRDELAARGLRPALKVFNTQPQLRLPDTWEECRSSHSKTFWKSPRRWRNKISREIGEARYVRLRDPEEYAAADLDATLADVFTVFERSWQFQAIEEAGAITPSQAQDFYTGLAHDMAGRGLDLNLLYAGDRPLAFDLNLSEGAALCLIFGGFDAEFKKYGPGSVLFVDEVRDGHGRGDRVLEFGGEFLDYKEQWTRDTVSSYQLRMRGRTPFARVRGLFDRTRVLTAKPGGKLGAAFVRRLNRSPIPPWALDFSRFHVFELPEVSAPAPESVGLRVEPVTADRLVPLAECREMADPEEGAAHMASRFDIGSVCVGLWQGERCVGYAWARQGENALEDRDRYRMSMGPRGAYVFDTYLHPEFRGQRLYPVLLRALQERMSEDGVARYYVTVDVYNPRSLKAHAKLGVRPLETITYRRFLGARLHTSHSERGARRQLDLWGSKREFVSRVVTEEAANAGKGL